MDVKPEEDPLVEFRENIAAVERPQIDFPGVPDEGEEDEVNFRIEPDPSDYPGTY